MIIPPVGTGLGEKRMKSFYSQVDEVFSHSDSDQV